MTETEHRIYAQEMKYRYITTKFLKELFKGKIIAISGTPVLEGVDIRFSAMTKGEMITYDVEVKERNKSNEQMITYPSSELKKSKFHSMTTAHTNQHLIYIQYVNEVAYIYDMDKIDMDDIPIGMWRIKKTQYADNSEYVEYPTYFIPYDMTVKKINASKYYKDYAANKTITKENTF